MLEISLNDDTYLVSWFLNTKSRKCKMALLVVLGIMCLTYKGINGLTIAPQILIGWLKKGLDFRFYNKKSSYISEQTLNMHQTRYYSAIILILGLNTTLSAMVIVCMGTLVFGFFGGILTVLVYQYGLYTVN